MRRPVILMAFDNEDLDQSDPKAMQEEFMGRENIVSLCMQLANAGLKAGVAIMESDSDEVVGSTIITNIQTVEPMGLPDDLLGMIKMLREKLEGGDQLGAQPSVN